MDADEVLSYLQQRNEADYAYCFGPVCTISDAKGTDGALLIPSCLHLVCRGCIPQYRKDRNRCPECRIGSVNESIPIMAQGVCQLPQEENGIVSSVGNSYPSKILAFVGDVSAALSQKR